jgi:AcrR family transcriptional regulator
MSDEMARTMALLWGTATRSGRGPKAGLDVPRIVREAIAIADEEGLGALTMRRVAEALGVSPMSLYTYVRNKTELIDLMIDAASESPPADSETGWRQAMERLGRDVYTGFQRHPWMLQVPMTRGLMGPNQTAAIEASVRPLDREGLDGREAMAVFNLVVGYAIGAARTAVDTAELEDETGTTTEQWWEDAGSVLSEHVTADRFPTLAKLWSADTFTDTSLDYFEFGLQRLLDGVESYLERK